MPRIGKKPITIPQGVDVTIAGAHVAVKGPKGTLEFEFHPVVKFEKSGSEIQVTVEKPEEKLSRSLWGTSRMLLANMIEGVTKGFEKKLEIHGVGFRAAVSGKKLTLNVGFSHPVEFPFPDDIVVTVEKNIIKIVGIDKQRVGQIAAEIRAVKKPEPYKGKGIKYSGEIVRRKAGKVVKAVGSG
ncbi:MAG: 50S ribosomal protein L6 [Patescibacteria group bacterium]|nr:50S ribosomal protein L6 [Patescibacteria group bacterium]MDD5715360.1 50S ribosomal protein L6 [Patescibacteria group bacterium]